jgi:hypothetical protein
MSLIYAKKFLQSLDTHFPVSNSGEHKRHHSLQLEGDQILLMLHLGSTWQTFLFDDNDLARDPEEIVLELKQLLKKE